MDTEEVENQEIIDGSLSITAAVRYLRIYLGEPTTETWDYHIRDHYNRIQKGSNAREAMRKTIACAILLPVFDKTDMRVPEAVLHKCKYWRQYDDRDWFSELQKVASKDLEIINHRKMMLSLGIIEPLIWQPYTRQAFNWLYGKAEDSGCITEQDQEAIKRRMSNLVYAYGGAVICSVFDKSPDWIKRVFNWRTGYFFERAIYQVYTPEEMYKIKRRELEKTNSKLVKSIRV